MVVVVDINGYALSGCTLSIYINGLSKEVIYWVLYVDVS